MNAQSKLTNDLQLLLGIIFLLLIIGTLFIYSASSVYALETFDSSHYYVKRQLIGICIGLCGALCAYLLPIKIIKQASPYLFLGALGLTTLTLVPIFGMRIHGSHRWLRIAGFAFQPSELLKITFIMYLGYFLEKKSHVGRSLLHGSLPLLIIIGLPSLILLKQPDFGMTVTLILTAFAVLFIAHFNTKHLMISLACFVPLSIGLILMKPYRLKRILTFLNPWHDPQGAGFQIIQSLIAIGSGGIAGTGITQSKQKFFYLPMQHTDFIFSIIAEETGFIGALFILLIYGALLYTGIRIATQLHSPFATLTTLGFIILTNLQAFINIAVATGMAPTKGLGLPFISYGNTALVCNLFMIGLIVNMMYDQMYTTH